MDMISAFKAIKSKTWFIPAAVLLAGVVIVVFVMVGCSDKNVDLVKSGVLEIDETRTVEQLLSAKFRKLKWRSFTSDDNRTVVEVTGVRTFSAREKEEYEESVRKLRSSKNNPKNDPLGGFGSIMATTQLAILPLIPQDGDRILIQFVISADKEAFDVQYCELRDSRGNLKTVGDGNPKLTSTTESAYENTGNFVKMVVL